MIIEKIHEVYKKNMSSADMHFGKTYLIKRGITLNSIDTFELGLHTRLILTEQGEEMAKLGKSISETLFLDYIKTSFSTLLIDSDPRIVYPLYKNEFGTNKLVGFHSRAIHSKAFMQHRHISNFYYNIFNEKTLDNSGKEIVITEGQNDCIIMCQNGFNSIGLLGVNSFKIGNAETLLSAGIERAYLIFDNDKNNSGMKGAIKTSNVLEEIGIESLICSIPMLRGREKTDLNDLFLNHPKSFAKTIKQSMSNGKIFKKKKEIKTKQVRIQFDRQSIKIWDLHYFPNIGPRIVQANCMLPGHEDNKSSFRLYTETNSFNCFGCGRGGNVVHFYACLNNVNYNEAVMKLRERIKDGL